jgi:hypothetical protein
LLFLEDELDVEFLEVDELVVVVLPTWCKATRPLNVPKLTSEATTSHFLNVRARASARAFGIFSGGLGF